MGMSPKRRARLRPEANNGVSPHTLPAPVESISKPGASPDATGPVARACIEQVFALLESEADVRARNAGLSVGEAAAHRTRNRYRNVLPYDQSRVRLSGIVPDYINASHLRVSPFLSGSGIPARAYIATQAPLPATFAHFWRMLLDQRSETLVALVDAEPLRCEQYWPDIARPVLVFHDEHMHVRLLEERVLHGQGEIVERLIAVESMGVAHRLRMLHYRTWPDHGVPLSFAAMDVLIGAVNEHSRSNPLVVHCSAGIGRTGTFCVLDTLVRLLDGGDQRISIAQAPGSLSEDAVLRLILDFRSQRRGIVQTSAQLGFIYAYLCHYMRNADGRV